MLVRRKIYGLMPSEGKWPAALQRLSDKKEAPSPPPPPPRKQKAAVDPRRVFKVYRYGGVLSGEQPKLESFDLDVTKCGPMMLDALIKLKDMDPTLTFRRSCREGICGSCAINLQGYNCLSCITGIPDAKTIVVYPLPHMYVQRDLVVDMSHFMDAYDNVKPYLIRPRDSFEKGLGQMAQSVPDNLKLHGLYECVLCACCSTSCPSYWWNGRRFLGPAALLHSYRWIVDSRDDNTAERLHALRDDFKLFRCHTIMNCSISCPRGLRPAEVIVRLKKLVAALDKKPPPDIDPMKFLAGDARKKEQYIFNVFEVIVSTLETKLQRIENLDKAVEHLMRRVEALDSRVNDNIHKTDAIISKLGNLDFKLFSHLGQDDDLAESTTTRSHNLNRINEAKQLDRKLESLDQKVSDIDTKLVGLKNQIDSNFLPVDDINAEASEKKPISLNVIEIAKGLNGEVVSEITKEIDQLRTSMSTVDRKLQFHINLVSENLGKVLYMVADVHSAIVEPESASINVNSLFKNRTATSTQSPVTKASKIDTLVNKIIPMMSVSEKMDEVWDVVVGTKSSVDDLVPKSDELLTQNQRQERAIGQIHNDLRLKTNLIIENLDMVEKRLKKQEDDVATLAQRPVPAELLLDPTIDRLVEYAPNRYRVDEPVTDPPATAAPTPPTSTSNSPNPTSASPVTVTPASNSSVRPTSRKGGIIFPSVKNKPIVGNNTFASEIVANYKDVKGYSCIDLLAAGMRESGVYYLQIRGTTYWFLKVYCEQNVADGGWTVIHRRDDFGVPAENFNRDWNDYKNGFGDPSREFWLGNENIYMLTNNDDYMLRIELEDFDGNKRYAQYSHFKIYSEAEYYKLEIEGYEGNAGDSLNDPWYGSNNSPFSTYNRDNDRSSLNCASMLKGGWWWKSCGRGLNGLYLHDPQDLTARQGIVWFRWRGWDYTLKRASMMIKPRGQQLNT